MDIKIFLEEYNFISGNLIKLQAELNSLIKEKSDTYNTLSAYNINGMPKGKGSFSDPVFSTVENLIDRYDKRIISCAQRINKIIDEKSIFDEIWNSYSVLSGLEKTIIELKYFGYYSWTEIGKKVSYSVKQCKRISNKAIEKIQVAIDKGEGG